MLIIYSNDLILKGREKQYKLFTSLIHKNFFQKVDAPIVNSK